jgi:4-amino-4-deoxy-L-arabinose transferase-like glycosyltransferase
MRICSSICAKFRRRKKFCERKMFRARRISAKKPGMLEKIRRWIASHPAWTLAIVTAGTLLPFLAKPFNMDDPLFIWTAKQIHPHPFNPFGFGVNWYGTVEPMWGVTENPPLAGYYLALAAGIFGWGEIALHSAFLLPAVAVILGTHRLARHFCNSPMLAALLVLFTPVFLVSSMAVMCDVLMLAFWVWAVVFWAEGIGKNDFQKLFFAALLVSLAVLTKYFGACLIPLLAAHALIGKRRFDRRLAFLLVPLLALFSWQPATQALYGHGLLTEAAGYAAYAKNFLGFSEMAAGLTALTFTGGCLATAFFFAPLLWRARTQAAFALGAIFTAAILLPAMTAKHDQLQGAARALVEFQVAFWAGGGICLLALALADVWDRRDERAWLLALWVLGTFLFAAFFNWTVNARSILPMAPAVGILIARRLEKKFPANGRTAWPRGVTVCIVFGGALALLVAQSDFLLAVAVRRSAQQVCARFGQGRNSLFFQGHWGFQYYMEAQGASALDVKHSRLQAGDCLAVPANNTSLFTVNSKALTLREVADVTVPGPRWLTTWSAPAGAGFYASAQGPLPFAFGPVSAENVAVYCLNPAAPAR